MTDAEIKKALECCIKAKTRADCEDLGCPACVKEGCAYYIRTDEDYEGVIFAEIAKDLVDLLNRQQAEVERLKQNLEEAHIDIREQLAKKENLRCVIEDLSNNTEHAIAEAIKECLDWVLSLFPEDKNFTTISRFTVKQKLKEMVGDAE